jgi:hypothetical protein
MNSTEAAVAQYGDDVAGFGVFFNFGNDGFNIC